MKISTLFIIVLIFTNAVFAENQQKLILEKITCIGNAKTQCKFIKKELRLAVQDEVSQDDLRDGKIRLSLLGVFESVKLSLEKGSGHGKVNLTVEVKESSSYYTVSGLRIGRVDFEDSYDTYDDSRGVGQGRFTGGGGHYQLSLGNRNLFGLGKRLSVSYNGFYNKNRADQSYRTDNVSLNYIDPNFLGSAKWFSQLQLSISIREDEYGEDEFLAGTLELGYRIKKFSYLSIGYGYFRQKNSYFQYFAGGYIGDFEERGRSEKGFILGYGFNTQDDSYFPTNGSRFELKLGLTSEEDFDNNHHVSFALSDLDWRTTWGLGGSWYLSGFLEATGFRDTDEFLNSGLGLEISHQFKRNHRGKDISDGRFYLTPSFGFGSSGLAGAFSLASGVKIKSKIFGLARFEVFYQDRGQ